jgi:DNA-binding beta-propeller fold protein YncE
MRISIWPVCGMILATCGLLAAQPQGTLTGPVAGFVFDGSGLVLRPIHGVPGASLLGDPVSFGIDVSAVFVAPRQDSAIVVGADQSLHLFQLNSGSPTEVSLGGLTGAPDRVVFSPSGTAAALMSGGSARVLTGLPNAPTLAGTVKVPGSVPESRSVQPPTESWALSDDGVYLLTVAQGSARLLSIHGQNRSLIAAQSGGLVAFAAGGHDAAVMDSLAGLTLIRDASGAAGTQVLAAPDAGLASPTGLAFSQDQQTLYVASSAAQSVAAFSLASASRTAIGCACTPSTLMPMGNLFRLTELTAAPLWLLDGTASAPRTVFVPARGE